jgi:hypothetical protein
MNHKQFENWILDEPELGQNQKKELQEHLAVCSDCRQLDIGWQASKELLKQAAPKAPQPGFKQRWLVLAEKKKQMVKVRRYRLTLLTLLSLAFATSLTYMVSSGYFLHMLADIFNSVSTLIIALTNSLSFLGSWLYKVPIAVPLSIGFVLFGFLNAFIMMGIFTLWNLKQRKLQVNEVQAD